MSGTFDMFAMIRAVFDEYGPRTPIQRAVMGALMRRADSGSQCYPGLTRIAQEAGCKKTAARAAVAGLEADGWLEIEDREGFTYMFTLCVPSMDRRRLAAAADEPTHPHDVQGSSVRRMGVIRQADPSAKRTPPPGARGVIRQADGGHPSGGPELSQESSQIGSGSQIPPTPQGGPKPEMIPGGPVDPAATAAARAPLAEDSSAAKAKRPGKKGGGEPRPKSMAVSMPLGWAPSPEHFEKGLKLKFDADRVRAEAHLFTDLNAAKGRKWVDWDAAFRNWLGNEAKWREERAGGSATAEAIHATQPGAPTAAQIRQAYAEGIVAAAGGSFVCEVKHLESLRIMVEGHAKGPTGEPIAPGEKAAWVRTTAEAYRRAVAADEARFQGGYSPPACIRWLNGGRKIVEPTATGGARFKSRAEESREKHNQRGHLDAEAAQIGTRAHVPKNLKDMGV